MLIFEIKNTAVEIRAGFFLIVTFMLLTCDSKTVTVSLFSSLIHESGHLAAMMFFAERAEKIVFSASGMRIDRKNGSFLSFSEEIIISASGVMMNFVICAAAYTVFFLTGFSLAGFIGAVNAVIGAFNLLPFEELDGGNILRFTLCRRLGQEQAEKVMNIVSVSAGIMLLIFFSLTVYLKKANLSLAFVILYLIILLINRILELKKSVI